MAYTFIHSQNFEIPRQLTLGRNTNEKPFFSHWLQNPLEFRIADSVGKESL
jgi:hypothetical protein